jgi:lysyl-tRNA synthetase class 2
MAPDLALLRQRAKLIQLIRNFFQSRGYLEVDTALLCPTLIPESALEVFQTRYRPRHGADRDLYLIPSPELWMKRLIAGGSGSIFQICKSFRNSEPATGIHNPEFTMLEWYTVDADYMRSIDVIEQLFGYLSGELAAGPLIGPADRRVDCSQPFLRLSMAEAFREHTGLDLQQLAEAGCKSLGEAARDLDIPVTPADRPEDLFHKIFLSAVEPNLPASRAFILYDYPALIPTLARRKQGTPWAERWELYLGVVEVANCYSEETDPAAYEDFYHNQEKAKRQSVVVHPCDWELVRVIRKRGFPECSGVALGLERLLIFLLGRDSIRDLVPYGAFQPTGADPPLQQKSPGQSS